MFKIKELKMISIENEEYIYKFNYGINYFKGKNGSGKTEFYKFIDYMFGSSNKIHEQVLYKDSLKQSSMKVMYNNITFILTRTINPDINYFRYEDESQSEAIKLHEYKDKLNAVFSIDESSLKDIRNFTEEDLTYRSFTLFNFLGEKRQGVLNDFFDKCSDTKYYIKLSSILNFIFNKNLKEIFELKKELLVLENDLKLLEESENKSEFIKDRINKNLIKLNSSVIYNGVNSDEIKNEIKEIKSLKIKESKITKTKTISELEVIYNNIDEQIKIYENRIQDSKHLNKEQKNRKLLLERLDTLIEENDDFNYLVKPLTSLIKDLDSSISFNKYIINDNTIKEMKKQRNDIKNEIYKNDCKFKHFDIDDKFKAISIIEECISEEICFNSEEIKNKKKRIKEIKGKIRVLQNSDDIDKVTNISNDITNLYKSARSVSELVEHDVSMDGFKIQYIKKGNILQPMIIDKNNYENYYTGSMARHTLIQLCGYLSFLKLLIAENKYPLIPILVIDHISKPFDDENKKAIGSILEKFYEYIGYENIQIFMFDDESNDDLFIKNSHVENLFNDKKSGFNPFHTEDTLSK